MRAEHHVHHLAVARERVPLDAHGEQAVVELAAADRAERLRGGQLERRLGQRDVVLHLAAHRAAVHGSECSQLQVTPLAASSCALSVGTRLRSAADERHLGGAHVGAREHLGGHRPLVTRRVVVVAQPERVEGDDDQRLGRGAKAIRCDAGCLPRALSESATVGGSESRGGGVVGSPKSRSSQSLSDSPDSLLGDGASSDGAQHALGRARRARRGAPLGVEHGAQLLGARGARRLGREARRQIGELRISELAQPDLPHAGRARGDKFFNVYGRLADDITVITCLWHPSAAAPTR